MKPCPLCSVDAQFTDNRPTTGVTNFACNNCRGFCIEEKAMDHLRSMDKLTRKGIACVVRDSSLKKIRYFICESDDHAQVNGFERIRIADLERQRPRTFDDRLNDTLLRLKSLSPNPGGYIGMRDCDWPWILFCTVDSNDYSRSDEAQFVAGCLVKAGLIEPLQGDPPNEQYPDWFKTMITHRGWTKIAELESALPESKKAFVAMSFSDDLRLAYEYGFAPGIRAAGYESRIIREMEYTGDVVFEILAEIRNSKFTVCDMTEHKNGCYFEAGFAMGLDKPLFFTARKGEVRSSHFDTRNFNHLEWSNPEELAHSLKSRILAVIKKGPLYREED